jgi:N-acetylmuramoyl-L-alanine amidase
MPATWIGAAAGNFQPGRPNGLQPQAIVIHIMDGSLGGTDSWFNDPRAKVSAHYGVGKAGAVHQYVKESDTAFHAGIIDAPTWRSIKPDANPNFYTIGVEHEGFAAEAYPWPQPQLEASLTLVAAIAARWNIACDEDHIVPHHAIRRGKTCPGIHFALADYVGRLNRTAPLAAAPAQSLHALSALRVRARPTTASQLVRVAAAGEALVATGPVAVGERVSGNALWYRLADGYVWAGATDRPEGG